MHRIQTALPRRELMDFVRVFAQRDISCAGDGFRQSAVGSLEQILAFEFGDLSTIHDPNGQSKLVSRIHVVGSQTASSGYSHYKGRHDSFGMFLKPLGPWQLFRIPPVVFANQNGDGRDLLGNGIAILWLRLAEKNSFEERIRVAEEYLLPFASKALPRTSVMETGQHMYRRNGAVSIQDLANECSLSLRQYERRFTTEIGFRPKLFARLIRFQAALDAKRKSPGGSWLTIAHHLGYFDQMHMVLDFKKLGGFAPSEVLQEIGDYQPWSLSAPATPYDFPEIDHGPRLRR